MSPNESDQTFATISNRKFYRLLDRMDGFSIRNPEYKPTMLPNKSSELYKEAEKMWNENRDLFFSDEENLLVKLDGLGVVDNNYEDAPSTSKNKENFSERSYGSKKATRSLEVVPVSKNDKIKGLLELIEFIENKNNLTISFNSFPEKEENVSTINLGKTTRNSLAKLNSNAVLNEKRSVKKSGKNPNFKPILQEKIALIEMLMQLWKIKCQISILMV